MIIGERIQALRKARGLSQEELAAQIGVSRQAVSKWEAGQSQPDLDKVVSLSQFFGVTTDDLLLGSESAPPVPKATSTLPSLRPDQRYFFIVTAANLGILLLHLLASLLLLHFHLYSGSHGLLGMICCLLCLLSTFYLYAVSSGLCLEDGKYIGKALRKKFWRSNIWIMLISPCILLYSQLREMHVSHPFAASVVLYFLISLFVFIFNMPEE